MRGKDIALGGLLTLAILVLPLWWLGSTHAQNTVPPCGSYQADWSDAKAFQPGCLQLGPAPLALPPPGDPASQWAADASRLNTNDALQLQWERSLGDWLDASGQRWGPQPLAISSALTAVGTVQVESPLADLRLVFKGVMPAVGAVRCGEALPLLEARLDSSTLRNWDRVLPSTRRVILLRCARAGPLRIDVTKIFSGSVGGRFEIYRNDPHLRQLDGTGLPGPTGTASDVVLDLRATGWRSSLLRTPVTGIQGNGMLLVTVPTGGATGASIHYPIPAARRSELMFSRMVMRIAYDWPATTGGKYPGLANTGATVRSGGIAGWGGRKADGLHWSARTNRANPIAGAWTASHQGWGTYVYRLNYESLNGDVRWSTRPLPKGEFVVIDQMVKLNGVNADGTPRADGEVAYWLNGELVNRFTGIIFRNQTSTGSLPESFWLDVYVGGTGYVAPYPHTVLFADVQVSSRRLPFDPLVLARLNANTRQTPP